MKRSEMRFLGLLALVFIGLKLAEVGVVASWSWWWVLAPLWGPPALFVTLLALVFLVGAICKSWRQ